MTRPYILDYPPQVEVKRKCGYHLGSQNPLWLCDMCKFIASEATCKFK